VPWAFGAPFLTSTYGYVHVPLVGEVELASAIGFDLGVFLTVVGVVLLSLSRIARIEQRAEGRAAAGSPAAASPARREAEA
jgi:multicomponent K+:H+ antiporter subunit A